MTRDSQGVPLTMGSPRATSAEADAFLVTDAWWPAGTELPWHHHDRPVFAVVLEGSFEGRFSGRAKEVGPASVLVEPAGEGHANRFGRAGARVLALQPDPTREELLRPLRHLLCAVHHFEHLRVGRLARRAADLAHATDDLAPLALEALALEMLGTAGRLDDRWLRGGRRPPWLERVEEMVRGSRGRGVRTSALAEEAGVHPVHLARVFRAHAGESVGSYARRLRLEDAAVALAEGDEPIARIALRAGFADQSHFTRSFRRWAGVPPGRYRRRARQQLRS